MRKVPGGYPNQPCTVFTWEVRGPQNRAQSTVNFINFYKQKPKQILGKHFRKFWFSKKKLKNIKIQCNFHMTRHMKITLDFENFRKFFIFFNKNFRFFLARLFFDFVLVKVYEICCRLSTILRPSDLSGKNCARLVRIPPPLRHLSQ